MFLANGILFHSVLIILFTPFMPHGDVTVWPSGIWTRDLLLPKRKKSAMSFRTHHPLPGFKHLPHSSATPSFSPKLRPHVGDRLPAMQSEKLLCLPPECCIAKCCCCNYLFGKYFSEETWEVGKITCFLWKHCGGAALCILYENAGHFSPFDFSLLDSFRDIGLPFVVVLFWLC